MANRKFNEVPTKATIVPADEVVLVDSEDSLKLKRVSATAFVGPQGPQGIPGTGGTWGTIDGTLSSQTDLQSALDGKVPTTRTVTINGEAKDLSGDVSFEVSAGSGGYAANVYLQNASSTTVPAYKSLSYVPEVSPVDLSVVVNSNTQLLATFLYDADVATTIVDAGEWVFNTHARLSTTAGTTTLTFVPFKRTSGGVETDLFTISSVDVNSVTDVNVTTSVTQPSFTVNATDRLGLKVYATTTHNSNVTVYVTVGDGNASYFSTPLAIRHSQLRARDASDSHPISAITNLQSSLDAKANLSGAAFTGAISATNLEGTNTGDQDLSGLVPNSRTLTINGESYDLSANRSWTISSGGGAVAQVSWAGPLVAGTLLARVTVTSAKTLAYVKASLGVLNTGASVLIDVRKNGTATTNSIFTSDTPLEIATSTSATNGVYTVTKTSIDNGAIVENDVLYIYATQVGSGVSGADLYLEVN